MSDNLFCVFQNISTLSSHWSNTRTDLARPMVQCPFLFFIPPRYRGEVIFSLQFICVSVMSTCMSCKKICSLTQIMSNGCTNFYCCSLTLEIGDFGSKVEVWNVSSIKHLSKFQMFMFVNSMHIFGCCISLPTVRHQIWNDMT